MLRAARYWAFGLGCCVIYLANDRIVSPGGDSVPARYLPFAVWGAGSLALNSLDTLTPLVTAVPPGKPYHEAYWLVRRPDGTLRSLYPIVTPLLLLPLYLPAALDLSLRGWTVERLEQWALWMEKLAAALMAAASAVLCLRLLERRLEFGRALLLAGAYAFGTATWSISSQALWQHGMAELLLVSGLLAVTVPASALGRGAIVAGLASGLLAANRPPDAALALALLIAVGVRDRRRGLIAAGMAVLSLLPFVAYNLVACGHWAGGYGSLGLAGSHPFYRHDFLAGLAGLLVSPAKGLFVFSPFLAVLLLARRCAAGFLALDASLALAAAVLVGFWARTQWTGGDCYGPRFLVDLLPALIWLAAPALARMSRRGVAAVAVSTVIAVAIQGVGALCYPQGSSDRLYLPLAARRVTSPAVWRFADAPFWVEARAGLAPRGLASVSTATGPPAREP